jgi:hypothetical protein
MKRKFWGPTRWLLLLAVVVLGVWAYYAWREPGPPAFRKACGHASGKIVDEAVCAYRVNPHPKQAADDKRTDAEIVASNWGGAILNPRAEDDYFHDMDGRATLNRAQLKRDLEPWVLNISEQDAWKATVIGRNNWIVWTAGNDRLWDVLANKSFGNIDLLKTISSAPGTKFGRHNRWSYLGLVNEPCFTEPKRDSPRQDRFGLYLDERVAPSTDCPADPFEDEKKYPGVKFGARGRSPEFPVGSLYGYATGVVGLRLFPNPDFDAKAQAKWDWYRYYNDPSYYNDKNLIRPYRVGMACAFCHVGPSPTNPPADPENPKWENINSNPGGQYFWFDRVFGFGQDYGNYIFQLFHTARPGALDTSLVSSDFINNPRTMNAVYSVGARLEMALRLGKETIKGQELGNRQFNDYPAIPASPKLTSLFKKPDTVFTPRVLKDGSDSVGALGALNRVYINIGLFSEEWLTHFNPIVGGTGISPIKIADGRKNSAYWVANEEQTPDVALFFLATAKPDKLEVALQNAPDSKIKFPDQGSIDRGKLVFADNCARCHSSKLPNKAFTFFKDNGCNNPNYLDCWKAYWNYTKTDEFKSAMRGMVVDPHFLEENFLSIDQRVPVTLLETNICSPIATNALRNNIWDNFSSDTYKKLPSVGNVALHDPYTGEIRVKDYKLPDGGRGFTRPASLISLWSTAPFLQNNSVGPFDPSPSLDSRMAVFGSSIHQMLWPQDRMDKPMGQVMFRTASGKLLPGQVDVTTQVSYIPLPKGYLPKFVADILNWFAGTHFITDAGLQVGPIPAGTPVNLFSNIDLDVRPNFFAEVGHLFKVGWTLIRLTLTLHQIHADTPPGKATDTFRKVVPALISVSKCPDYIVNRGHYFGTEYEHDPWSNQTAPGLTNDQKNDLIEFLKTL